MSTASHAVFLSYASEDAPAAQRIAEALRAAGIEVWFDREELRGGDAWDQKIRQQIRDCRLFVPIISAHADARQEGYFRKEWKWAVDRTHEMSERVAFLVPVVIDGTSDARADVPDRFREVQWTRLSRAEVPQSFVERVKRLLSSQSSYAPAVETAAPVHFVGGQTPNVAIPTRWHWAIGALFAVALSYFVVDKFWLSKRTVATANSAAQSATAPEKSIAVLPFVDLSEKRDQEYFADGMTEEIIELLAKIPGLTVIGRTSSFQFKGKNVDLRTIGTQLNAAYVLEGSVRRSGDQVRITAQLINTRTGTHEWSGTYDRRISDVLQLQDAIAAAVARELQITVTSGYPKSRATLKDADVYELLLRGRHAFDRFDNEGFAEAASLFQRALDLDPASADAAAELAFAYEAQGEWVALAPATAFEQARRLATMALTTDPNNALAHYVLGYVHTVYDCDWAAAEREFRQVRALAPGKADGLLGQAVVSRTLGRWDDALRQVNDAITQDPLSPDGFSELTAIQWMRSHPSEAEAAARRMLDIRPTYGSGHFKLGLVLLWRGQLEGALVEMQRETDDEYRDGGLAIAYYALGKRANSDAALARMVREGADRSPFLIAEVFAFRGQVDEGMHWLERAYIQKDPELYTVKSEPPILKLAADPRFKALLQKMNLPE